jgi:2-methylcitrate dehydratase
VKTKFPLHKPKKVAGLLDSYTEAYPEKMKGQVTIKMKNGDSYSLEKDDYYGFHTRPMSWTDVEKKFKRLTTENADNQLQAQIIDVINNLENHSMSDLISLITAAGKT